jgi:hypothetical protein
VNRKKKKKKAGTFPLSEKVSNFISRWASVFIKLSALTITARWALEDSDGLGGKSIYYYLGPLSILRSSMFYTCVFVNKSKRVQDKIDKGKFFSDINIAPAYVLLDMAVSEFYTSVIVTVEAHANADKRVLIAIISVVCALKVACMGFILRTRPCHGVAWVNTFMAYQAACSAWTLFCGVLAFALVPDAEWYVFNGRVEPVPIEAHPYVIVAIFLAGLVVIAAAFALLRCSEARREEKRVKGDLSAANPQLSRGFLDGTEMTDKF